MRFGLLINLSIRWLSSLRYEIEFWARSLVASAKEQPEAGDLISTIDELGSDLKDKARMMNVILGAGLTLMPVRSHY